jgi:hypothetical protein
VIFVCAASVFTLLPGLGQVHNCLHSALHGVVGSNGVTVLSRVCGGAGGALGLKAVCIMHMMCVHVFCWIVQLAIPTLKALSRNLRLQPIGSTSTAYLQPSRIVLLTARCCASSSRRMRQRWCCSSTCISVWTV